MHSLGCDKMNLLWPNDSIILTFYDGLFLRTGLMGGGQICPPIKIALLCSEWWKLIWGVIMYIICGYLEKDLGQMSKTLIFGCPRKKSSILDLERNRDFQIFAILFQICRHFPPKMARNIIFSLNWAWRIILSRSVIHLAI